MRLRLDEPVLFLDDSMITAKDGVQRHFHRPAKDARNPLLVPDRDWEFQYCLYGTVIYDQEAGLFKMWHYGGVVGSVGPNTMYATSRDGLQWDRPALNLFDVPNRKVDNNIVVASRPGFRPEAQAVLFEPSDDPARRYKLLLSCRPRYRIWYSPDGIHFSKGEEFDVEKPGYVDVGVLVRDPITRMYRFYHRGAHRGRAVAYRESIDLKSWTRSQLILHADEQDPPDSELYKFSPVPYGNYWIGMLTFFNHGADHCMLWPTLAWSLDGLKWERRREPFIPLGTPGEWDRFNNSVATQPLVVRDELWIYYSGRTYRHGPYAGKAQGPRWGAIGLARLRLDGFASLGASFDGGTVQTRPFVLPAGELHLNVKADHGEVAVEVLDEENRPLAGYKSAPIKGDEVLLPVTWHAGLGLTSLAGRTVSLRVTLRNARLYAFRVGNGRGLGHLSGPR